MNAVRLTLAACALLTLSARGEDRKPTSKADKLVGTWEVVKGHLPAGATVTFTRDGKLTIKGEREGKPFKIAGTYKLDSDKIVTTVQGPDGKERTHTHTIKSLTDKELIVEDDKGESITFKRKGGAGKVGKYEAVIKGMVGQLNELADALGSVKDKDTAKTAAGTIDKICDRLSELGKEAQTLTKLPKDEDDKLMKKYQPELLKATKRIQGVAFRAGQNSGGEPAFLKSLMRLQEVGKALQALDKR